jgi:glycosyltransferase involved in cell wall biosynthesis
MPSILNQFDIALAPYPALDHAFYFSPLKLFEYMACGLPVVAADLGQISDVVTHRKTGMLYSAGNLEGLVAQCEALLQSVKLRHSLGAAAAALVAREHTWPRNADQVVKLATNLIDQKRR